MIGGLHFEVLYPYKGYAVEWVKPENKSGERMLAALIFGTFS